MIVALSGLTTTTNLVAIWQSKEELQHMLLPFAIRDGSQFNWLTAQLTNPDCSRNL
jgi:hypothetical protein